MRTMDHGHAFLGMNLGILGLILAGMSAVYAMATRGSRDFRAGARVEHGIGLAHHRNVEQRLAGADAAHHAPHLGASFHLQTVWAIIPVLRRAQKSVQIARQIVPLHSFLFHFRSVLCADSG